MQNKKMKSKFAVLVVMTVLYCVGSMGCCVLFGQRMAATHMDPHYMWRLMQIAAAAIIGIAIACNKNTRGKWYWYTIPVLLIGAAFAYVAIVGQYPCCIGG